MNLQFPLAITLAIVFVPLAQAQVSCTAWDRPVGTGYLEATNKCDIGMVIYQDTVTCQNSDGSTAATFNGPLSVRHVPEGGWLTWSSPPDSESPTPWVGYTPSTTETVTLTNAAAVAGFELEPNAFHTIIVTVSFKDSGGTQLASVTRMVDGAAGARLFAVNCCEQAIKSMVVTVDESSLGFALGQVRGDTILGGVELLDMGPIIDPEEIRNADSNTLDR